ncbi:tyrosine-protein phosphatase [Alphaproteobacteria bacterium]|nr:tyrosine-protein phosphatase [Alphaproteobacteria bacterium]
MAKQSYDYVQPKDVKGKIFLTCFPGRSGSKVSFEEDIFLEELNNFFSLNSNTVVTLVKDNEIEKLCDKKFFVQKIYSHNLKWIHMPIVDLKSPDHKFMDKWQTTKVLLKNDLIEGRNIVLHCMGGKGRTGTIAAILLIEFGEKYKEAIKIVRKKRKGAIETKEQEEFIFSYRP